MLQGIRHSPAPWCSRCHCTPNFNELVQALDFVIKNDYPARGEYAANFAA
jgi:hypothetical protein